MQCPNCRSFVSSPDSEIVFIPDELLTTVPVDQNLLQTDQSLVEKAKIPVNAVLKQLQATLADRDSQIEDLQAQLIDPRELELDLVELESLRMENYRKDQELDMLQREVEKTIRDHKRMGDMFQKLQGELNKVQDETQVYKAALAVSAPLELTKDAIVLELKEKSKSQLQKLEILECKLDAYHAYILFM
jgi:predicted nuclease with TOPRIM domain